MSRLYCSHCLRPVKTCICALAEQVQTETRVTVLQHPNEFRHSKNSAQLLHLSLPNSRLITGLDFTAEDVLPDTMNNFLLYPDTNTAGTSICFTTNPPQKKPAHLIVLDGTWRNSRQLLHRNPWLKAIPRLAISPNHNGLYYVRKAQSPEQLSTFEATCCALEVLEDKHFPKDLLMHTFKQFVKRIAEQNPTLAKQKLE